MVRFVREIGLMELGWNMDDNLWLVSDCSGHYGKGQVAARLSVTHFVGKTADCLWSVAMGPIGNSSGTLQVSVQ